MTEQRLDDPDGEHCEQTPDKQVCRKDEGDARFTHAAQINNRNHY